jgi:hypothetical protein
VSEQPQVTLEQYEKLFNWAVRINERVEQLEAAKAQEASCSEQS